VVLEKEIAERIKSALKKRDLTELSVLRMLSSEIKNRKIADLVKGELDDDKILGLIRKMARQHAESIESFGKGGREDLVKKEKEELLVLEAFLPRQMTESEMVSMVEEAVKETGASSMRDMGAVMNLVISKAEGRADNKAVSEIVKRKLSV
jgi:uncharacterized protein